jgi:hypothetical protein
MYWLDKILIRKRRHIPFFPYSNDPEIKRQELIKNFENGVLFEDLELFVEWNVPFRNLQRYVRKKQKNKSYLDHGRHIIIDGLEVFLEPHKLMINSLPFINVSSFLGFDEQGHNRFLEVTSHLIDKFGNPTRSDNTLPFDFRGAKSTRWIYPSFQISLNVWERFAIHFDLRIESIPTRTTANSEFGEMPASE